jgi:hypothetical protein
MNTLRISERKQCDPQLFLSPSRDCQKYGFLRVGNAAHIYKALSSTDTIKFSSEQKWKPEVIYKIKHALATSYGTRLTFWIVH